MHERGNGVPDGDVVGLDEVGPVGWIAIALGIGQNNGASCCQQAEDIVNGEIKAQGGQGENAIAHTHTTPLIDIQNRIHGSSVVNHYAFGCSSGAGGVDDVGKSFVILDFGFWILDCRLG